MVIVSAILAAVLNDFLVSSRNIWDSTGEYVEAFEDISVFFTADSVRGLYAYAEVNTINTEPGSEDSAVIYQFTDFEDYDNWESKMIISGHVFSPAHQDI